VAQDGDFPLRAESDTDAHVVTTNFRIVSHQAALPATEENWPARMEALLNAMTLTAALRL